MTKGKKRWPLPAPVPISPRRSLHQRHCPYPPRARALDLHGEAAQRQAGGGEGGAIGRLLDLVLGPDASRVLPFPHVRGIASLCHPLLTTARARWVEHESSEDYN